MCIYFSKLLKLRVFNSINLPTCTYALVIYMNNYFIAHYVTRKEEGKEGRMKRIIISLEGLEKYICVHYFRTVFH